MPFHQTNNNKTMKNANYLGLLFQYIFYICTMTKKDSHIIPSIVTSYMDKFGCNNAQFITTNDDGDVYSLSQIDKNGNALPIGLPIFVILKDNKVSVYTDKQALEYQDNLFLDD